MLHFSAARVRAMNNTVDGITAAWYSFQDRYRAYPGDYLDANASVNLPGGPAGGDGDGIVGWTQVGSADAPIERGLVWVHLEAAGYITGGLKTLEGGFAANEYNCTALYCPPNGFGAGFVITHNTLSYSQETDGIDAHELLTGRGVPVEVLAELDRKVDDGLAITGTMQAGLSGNNWTTATACVGKEGVGPEYELLNPSDNCAGVFRNF